MAKVGVELVSASVADWSREKPQRLWDPSRRLIQAIRNYQKASQSSGLLRVFRQQWWKNVHRFWSVVTQCEINLEADIGGGFLMPHPNGIVIHPDSRIGPNCMIFQQVTLAAGETGSPRLGGHVDIGAGAKILGDVTIGDHAVIGANAVVLTDVPAYHTAVGIPARILPPRKDRVETRVARAA
ncbi:serine O-acetyltransferase [Aureimonas altamirensis DSM 21988]|uniref:Serine O-acetyltransferase n=1 Tax=Aureimonas altamirensis DSM 21988 TaxID=1121026 RepID=A0ABY1I3U5_9HYPH|nr:serine acetyltransferase [Aureimonas altamirensis]SHI56708.1 serine O-acetyltransferase [Aureimonas altamirensis DSM 21988]